MADVVLRAFRKPVPGTYELVGFASGLAMPLTSWVRGHVHVDLLLGWLPPAGRAAAQVATRLLVAGLFVLLCWNLLRFGLDLRASGEVSPTLELGFAMATVGTLGNLLPPSVTLIVFGIIAQQSIGRLFLAGLMKGYFTPTEAGSVGALAVIVMATLRRGLDHRPAAAPPRHHAAHRPGLPGGRLLHRRPGLHGAGHAHPLPRRPQAGVRPAVVRRHGHGHRHDRRGHPTGGHQRLRRAQHHQGPFSVIYRGVYPFLLALAAVGLLLFVFPALATFLPSVLMP